MKPYRTPLLALLAACFFLSQAGAETSGELRVKSEKALRHLYDGNAKAREIGEKAVAVLVFPDIYKAGFMIGAQCGNGILFKDGKVTGYYNSTAASYGLQAGIQKFSYALFFMDVESLRYLDKSGGFEVGGAPSLVVADEGVATSLSTTTLQKGIYAFFFGQKGLMAGLSLQGTKISRYTPGG